MFECRLRVYPTVLNSFKKLEVIEAERRSMPDGIPK
jgi:hypothetical protein